MLLIWEPWFENLSYILIGDTPVGPTQKEIYYPKNIFTSAYIDIQQNLQFMNSVWEEKMRLVLQVPLEVVSISNDTCGWVMVRLDMLLCYWVSKRVCFSSMLLSCGNFLEMDFWELNVWQILGILGSRTGTLGPEVRVNRSCCAWLKPEWDEMQWEVAKRWKWVVKLQ